MKLINRETDYAIRALCYLARQPREKVSSNELGRVLVLPRPGLRKVLQILEQNNLVRSTKGAGGGFELKQSAGSIPLTRVIAAFQGPVELSACVFNRNICVNRKTCMLRKRLLSIEANVIKQFRAITIASLNGADSHD